MNRSRFSGRNQNQVSFKSQARTIGPVSNTITLIVLSCLLGLLYLTQVTKTNALGTQIYDLQKNQSALQTQYENLQVASARLQSLNRVQESAVAKSLVSVAPTASVQN
ncbi:MAG: hypothetical protein ACHQT9_00630 [Candidatus Saccharimonadales bacterium]